MTETPQEPQAEPGWLQGIRAKARAYDRDIPRLHQDLAVIRSNVDDEHPNFHLWQRDYAARVKAGEASWADHAAVAADADSYGLIREAIPDHSVAAATQARIEAASAESVSVDPQTSARERMAQARDMDQFIASAKAAGVAVVEE